MEKIILSGGFLCTGVLVSSSGRTGILKPWKCWEIFRSNIFIVRRYEHEYENMPHIVETDGCLTQGPRRLSRDHPFVRRNCVG